MKNERQTKNKLGFGNRKIKTKDKIKMRNARKTRDEK
jgi:hypothetical protein